MPNEAEPLDPAEWARVHDEGDPEQAVFRRGLQLAASWCESYLGSGKTWLDVGSGSGHLAARLSAGGARLVGIDQSFEMTRYSATRWGSSFFVAADAKALPVASSSLDGIVAVSLLGYIREPQQFFQECARALRADGRLCVTLTNRFSLPLKLLALRRLIQRNIDRRFVAHDCAAICDALRTAGFSIERQYNYGRWGEERDVDQGTRSWIASNSVILARRNRPST